MLRKAMLIAVTFVAATAAMGADAGAAVRCRDHHGRFTKCVHIVEPPRICRNLRTKRFARCGSPGAVTIGSHR